MKHGSARVHTGWWRFFASLMLALAAVASPRAISGEAEPPVIPPSADPEELPPEKKKQFDMPGGVDWDAMRQSFVEEKKAFVLSGSAFVRFQGIKLEADNIVFFRETREVYAEGNIRLRVGESEISAETAYIDASNLDVGPVGYLIDSTVRVSAPSDALKGFSKKSKEEEKEEQREEIRQLTPEKLGVASTRVKDPYGVYVDPTLDPQARANMIFRAQRVIFHGKMHLSAEDAFVTSDDMVHPMYGVAAGKVDFYMKEVPDPDRPGKTKLTPHKVVAKRGRINIMGFSLFPFPTITYDLIRRNAFFSANTGSSKRWGQYGLLRLGYGLGGSENKLFDPTRVYIDLEERWRRGPGGGFEFEWQTGYRPPEQQDDNKGRFERGQGHVRVWTIDEIQISHSDDIIRARRDLERKIQPKFDGFPRRSFDANLLFSRRRKLQDAGPPSFEIDEHKDQFRGTVDFGHHQPLKRFAGVDNLQMDLKYQRETDRDVLPEYFNSNYNTQNQPEGLASLRKPGDNYSIELLYRGNPQDFDAAPPRSPVDYGTFTGYEPALTYSLTPTPIYCGFVVTGEVQGARLRRDFERDIYDQDGFDANRLYAKVDVARPFKLGAVNFVPHVGTQQQFYDNSRTGGNVSQGALTYGLDMTSRFYGTFPDFENEALGVRGLRHIVEPRISWSAVGDTRESAEDMLDFDEVDDLTPVEKITFAVDQTAQTRRVGSDGTVRTSNFAGFDMSVDMYPRSRDQDRLLQSDHLDLFRMDGFLRVVDVVRFDGSLGFSLEDGKLEKAAYGISIDPQTRWRVKFEERFNFDNDNRKIIGSDQFRIKFEYQISERWGLSVERINERRKSVLARKGRQVERITLTRSYGALDASFTYAVDRNIGESTYFFTVRPALVYRNLIVPTQDLLVDSAEVSGDTQEAPEEHNFDPMELLKKKKKKGAPSKKGDVLPPPPPGGRNDDVPTPPPPTPDKRASIRGGDSEVGSFEDPKAPSRPNAKKTRVDDDDWSTTPASTR